MRHLLAGLLVCIGLVSVPLATVLGQSQTRAVIVNEAASANVAPADYLPFASAFGSEWLRVGRLSHETPSETFAQAVAATYGGPRGARINIGIAVVADGRVRRAWDEAGEWFETYQRRSDVPYWREDELLHHSPPDGCDEIRRTDGWDHLYPAYPVGIALCAIDPDVLILVMVSGDIQGKRGWFAADAVIKAAIAAASER